MQKTHANHVKSRLDGHFGSSDGFEKTHTKTHMSGECWSLQAVISLHLMKFIGCHSPRMG